MKKKITSVVSVLLCAALALSLTSCGGIDKDDEKLIEDAFYDAVSSESFNDKVVEEAEELVADSEQVKIYYDTEKNYSYVLNKNVEDAAPVNYHISEAVAIDIDNDSIEEMFIMSEPDVNNYITVSCCDFIPYPSALQLEPAYIPAYSKTLYAPEGLKFATADGKVHLFAGEKDMGEISLNGSTLEFSNEPMISSADQEKDMSVFFTKDDLKYEYNGTPIETAPDFCYQISGLDIYYKVSEIEKISGQKILDSFKNAPAYAKMTVYGEEYLHLIYFTDYFEDLMVTGPTGTTMFVTNEYFEKNLAD